VAENITTKGQRNILDRRKERALENWLESQWERIEGTKLSRNTIAAQATEALGFPVSGGNVKGAAITLGKKLPKCRPGVAEAKTRKASFRITANALATLYRRVGEEPPEDFAALCAGFTDDDSG
jgi:hypothetical protein